MVTESPPIAHKFITLHCRHCYFPSLFKFFRATFELCFTSSWDFEDF